MGRPPASRLTAAAVRYGYPEPAGDLARSFGPKRLARMLRSFGPAAIVASASIGAGETVVATRAGAWAEYRLLWVVALAVLAKSVFVVYLLGRYTAVSGEYVGTRLARLPGPRGWLLVLILAVELAAAPFIYATIGQAAGNLLAAVAGFGDQRLWALGFIALALVLGAGVSYANLERQQIAICAVLVAGTIVGTALVRPDLGALVRGALSFGAIPEFPDWVRARPEFAGRPVWLELATTFGFAGNIVVGYVVYAHWVALHGWGINGSAQIERLRARAQESARVDFLADGPGDARRARRLLAPLRWDVALGAGVLFVVTAAFLISGAAVLYPQERLPAGFALLTEQRSIWEAIHPVLIPVYYVTVLAALWGTLSALPECYARVSHEFLGALSPRLRALPYRRVLRVVGGLILGLSAPLVVGNVRPVAMMDWVALLSTNLGVAAAATGALWLNRQLPGPLRTARWVEAAATLSTALLWAVSGVSVWQMARKYLGG